ncbi:hypothetical protein LCGC14_2085580 [marine sediment metagenome]|uniref:Uncharacterized protein n=1 Tax=marine sediment metagenome TaxID=412755 RepID=A0A0F9HBB8_9ZZZZ
MPEGYTVSEVIAITGHRDYTDRANFYKGLNNLRAKEYVFGGARGADTDALEYIGRSQPVSMRTVVVPNRVIDQPVQARAMIKRYATRVVELRNRGNNRFQIRNRNMVDRSTHVRAFYDFRGRGGTYNTIQYAKLKGKSYDIWNIKEVNLNKYMKMSRTEFQQWFNGMRESKVNLLSVKGIVLRYVKNILNVTMPVFLEMSGFIGVNALEDIWND